MADMDRMIDELDDVRVTLYRLQLEAIDRLPQCARIRVAAMIGAADVCLERAVDPLAACRARTARPAPPATLWRQSRARECLAEQVKRAPGARAVARQTYSARSAFAMRIRRISRSSVLLSSAVIVSSALT